tara:strand:+ start:433 stop:606 length:174 start_codon:yes stop_codon:yes gene_type:complete
MPDNAMKLHLQLTQTVTEQCPIGTPIEDIYQYYVDYCKTHNISPLIFGEWFNTNKYE